jgi:hypothetical protein
MALFCEARRLALALTDSPGGGGITRVPKELRRLGPLLRLPARPLVRLPARPLVAAAGELTASFMELLLPAAGCSSCRYSPLESASFSDDLLMLTPRPPAAYESQRTHDMCMVGMVKSLSLVLALLLARWIRLQIQAQCTLCGALNAEKQWPATITMYLHVGTIDRT